MNLKTQSLIGNAALLVGVSCITLMARMGAVGKEHAVEFVSGFPVASSLLESHWANVMYWGLGVVTLLAIAGTIVSVKAETRIAVAKAENSNAEGQPV